MATPQKDKEPSEKVTKKAEEKPKKQTKPRKPRPKPYQMTTVVVAKETALLFGSIAVFMALAAAILCAVAWFFNTQWPRLLGYS